MAVEFDGGESLVHVGAMSRASRSKGEAAWLEARRWPAGGAGGKSAEEKCSGAAGDARLRCSAAMEEVTGG
jgi:hypothetical protein